MKILVVADHTNIMVAGATLNTITAAQSISTDIDVIVAGCGADSVAKAVSQIDGVSKVLHADNAVYDHMLAENVAALILDIADGYTHIMAPATTTGKNILPRVAALLDVGMISDVLSVESDDTFKRPIYAGSAIATVQSSDPVKVLTVRATAFEPVNDEGGSAPIEMLQQVVDQKISAFEAELVTKSERPELTAANIVISGGRALGSTENFELIYRLADQLGAAVGASRAAVDAGYVPNDMQVGQTGKMVAPDLYIAVGISGAIQHLAGMKDSKVIVAINTDAEAPIFQVADYGLVGDLFDVLPELEKLLAA
ncbi:MAG: electron transfer flavoprotein subunit alpha/FixB family protein [Proteobacteria bacterium]|jgi:electron transfer flavoprotein alpha subunit|nr:electron transfer flavoprotein subunit alpha/FixB family protein [Pseudomonadota bacterium]